MSVRANALSIIGRAHGLVGVAILGVAVTGCAQDLRGELVAAGVFSPRSLEVGKDDLVTLGQMLFFDRELSGSRNIACATCHLPALHAGDARHLSIGQDGARLSRSVIEPFNRSFATSMFWDGRIEERDGEIVAPLPLPEGIETLLEAQALFPLLDRHEMRGMAGDHAEDGRANELAMLDDEASEAIWSAIVARIVAIEGYRALLASAFPGVTIEDITIVHLARAIAAFESHLWELTDTSFDRFLGSVSNPPDEGAMAEPERRGAELFFGDAGCARCHSGPLLSDGAFHAIGVPQIGPGRDALHQDEGRFAVTRDPADRFAFRTPSLRNVSLTAPYMHDGAFVRLEDAVRHHLDPEGSLAAYDGSQLSPDLQGQIHFELSPLIAAAIDPEVRPLRALSDEELWDVVFFLGTLSSQTEQALGPEAGIPRSVPSGLPVDAPPSGLEQRP
ncbi:MAG: c-type cytochrome [Sandaracinaceae bacterium]|nr:c-type cytochrome [Sandaracinaceae bacterium]